MVEEYGVDAPAAFEDACTTLLFFAGAGPTTAQWMSDTLGQRTVVSASAGASRQRERLFTQGGSTSKSEASAPLIGADELRALPKGTLIVSAANERPFMVRVIQWNKTRLRRRAGCMASPACTERTRLPLTLDAPAPVVQADPTSLVEEIPARGDDEPPVAATVPVGAPPVTKATTPRAKAPATRRRPRVTVPDDDPFASTSRDD